MVVYLQSDPIQCLERIGLRGRKEEKGRIDLDYVIQLHELHEEWYPRSGAMLVDTNNLDREEAMRCVLERMKNLVQIKIK